ncbi:MAG TPA: 30S ribosomal protein S5 [Candidatus Saccharimonadales bacterium]|nr:30S ribosomal protein S5 [Candidatus Saccharimonadales bacterium]
MPNAVNIERQPQGQHRNNDRRNDRRSPRNDAPAQEKIFTEYVINVDRVARVVKGGRRFRFKALVAVGDSKQRVGVGVAKGQDVQSAIAKAVDRAKKSLVTIPIVNSTIPHEVESKIGGAKIMIMPAAPGTGIITGGTMRAIIGLTGITNLLGKSLGSTNKVNNAYAVIDALSKLVPADQWVNKPSRKAKKAETKAEEKPAKVAAKKEAK